MRGHFRRILGAISPLILMLAAMPAGACTLPYPLPATIAQGQIQNPQQVTADLAALLTCVSSLETTVQQQATFIATQAITPLTGDALAINDRGYGTMFSITGPGAAIANTLQSFAGIATNPVGLQTSGSDTNISIEFLPKGAGGVGFGTPSPATMADVKGDITDENVKSCNTSTTGLGTDANGKLICNTISGAGSGTVNSGTAGQVAWYAASGTAVSGNANLTVNSSGNLTVGGATQLQAGVTMTGLSVTPGSKQPMCIDTTTGTVYKGTGGAC